MTANNDGQQLLLTIPQAARRLGLGRTTVYELTAFVERIRDQSVTKR